MFLSRLNKNFRYFLVRFKSTKEVAKKCPKWECMKRGALEMKEAAQLELAKPGPKHVGILSSKTENFKPLEPFTEDYMTGCKAIIKPRCKVVTQQGTNNLGSWELTFETKERWENPTMGWCSSGFPCSNLVLNFPDKESAVEFALNRGWNVSIDETASKQKPVKFKVKSYADNFSYNKKTRVTTK